MSTPWECATASGGGPRGGRKKGRTSAGPSRRDWSGLPDPALFAIAMSLTGSLADVLAFGCVCRAWRSVAEANERELMSSLPPLLFRGRDADFYCPTDGRSYKNRRLTALLELEGEERFQNIGCSFGHLIVTRFDENGVCGAYFVVNPLTGTIVCRFPRNLRLLSVAWTVLSSPPASPDCVVWTSDEYSLEFCRPGYNKWTICSNPNNKRIPKPVFLGGKGYFNHRRKLSAFDINPCSKLAFLPMGASSSAIHGVRLCASDTELLRIMEVRYGCGSRVVGFLVHTFDFSVAEWVILRTLGDRALLWDAFSATLSDEPGRWGGCGNCIYFVDLLNDELRVFHLEDGKIECLARGSPLNPKFRLKSPVWVLPNMCY